MIHNIKTIDQTGIKALLKERVEHPEKYINTPLIIWRADLRDDVHEEILRDVFNEFNADRTGRDRRWYKIATVHEMPKTKGDILFDMLHNPFVDKNDNDVYTGPVTVYTGNDVKRDTHRIGLFVIDPYLASLDYGRNPESLKKYHSVVNNRKWDNVELVPDIPVVAYMCITEPWFETPEVYADAEQYLFVTE